MQWIEVIGLSTVLVGSCGLLFGATLARWMRVDAERRALRAAILSLMAAP